jgi:hypothetical protein
MFMASLADLLDPDQWILSGKSLLDFPWPEGKVVGVFAEEYLRELWERTRASP